MLINITWALVLAGLGLVIGGFIADDQNILLILAIAAELAAIILVLASWARRAKDAAGLAFEDELTFAGEQEEEEPDDEELFATLGDEEEFAVGSRRPARRPARRTTRTRAKPKAKAKRTAKPTAAKRKPAAKAKPKATTRKTPARKPVKAKPKASPRKTQGRRRSSGSQ